MTCSYSQSATPEAMHCRARPRRQGLGRFVFCLAAGLGAGQSIAQTVSMTQCREFDDPIPSQTAVNFALPAGSTVLNAELELVINHAEPGELMVTLSHAGTDITVIDQPGIGPLGNPGCSIADLDVVLSDFAVAPVETACGTSSPALAGLLVPNQRLSGFRNHGSVGPWTLSLADSGTGGQVPRWCLTLEVHPEPGSFFPHTDLPGSAEVVDLRTENTAQVSGVISGARDIDWFFILQDPTCVLSIESTVTPDTGAILQMLGWAYPRQVAGLGEYPPGPTRGDCAIVDVGGAIALPGAATSQQYFRVQGCPGRDFGGYTIDLTKTGVFCQADGSLDPGLIVGTLVESGSLTPVGLATVQSNTNAGTLSESSNGDFFLSVTAGDIEVRVDHPDYATTFIDAGFVADLQVVDLGTIELTPSSFTIPPPSEELIFRGGFE